MTQIDETPITSRLRMELQGRILTHKDRSKVVQNPYSVLRMPASELMAVASKLGIDPRSVSRKMERFDDLFLRTAFYGAVEFKYTLSIGSKAITRKLRVDYHYTPEWEYYDETKAKLRVGYPYFEWHATVLIPPSREMSFVDSETGATISAAHEWGSAFLSEVRPIFGDLEDEIIAIVDKQCRDEDARRRAVNLCEK